MKTLHTNDDSLLLDLGWAFLYLDCIHAPDLVGRLMYKGEAFTLQLTSDQVQVIFNQEKDLEKVNAAAHYFYSLFMLDRSGAVTTQDPPHPLEWLAADQGGDL